jgi:hypothetical protein
VTREGLHNLRVLGHAWTVMGWTCCSRAAELQRLHLRCVDSVTGVRCALCAPVGRGWKRLVLSCERWRSSSAYGDPHNNCTEGLGFAGGLEWKLQFVWYRQEKGLSVQYSEG